MQDQVLLPEITSMLTSPGRGEGGLKNRLIDNPDHKRH